MSKSTNAGKMYFTTKITYLSTVEFFNCTCFAKSCAICYDMIYT